jgi:hypothetical protein
MALSAPPGIGLLKGLGVTIKHLFQRPSRSMYPHERDVLPPRTRGRHRADGRELHRLHAVQPRVPRLVHLHRLPQGDGAAGQGGRDAPVPATSSTGSRSTSRCACTAASASRCAPSTRCGGRRSSSTPSTTWAALLHEMDKLREWGHRPAAAPARGGRRPAGRGQRRDLQGREGARARRRQGRRGQAGGRGTGEAGGEGREEGKAAEGGDPGQGRRDRSGDLRRADRRGQVRAHRPVEGEGGLRQEGEGAAPGRAEAAGGAEADAAARCGSQGRRGQGRGRPDRPGDLRRADRRGQAERMARAKAKAAYVKKEKARLRAEAESDTGDAPGREPAEVPSELGASPEAAREARHRRRWRAGGAAEAATPTPRMPRRPKKQARRRARRGRRRDRPGDLRPADRRGQVRAHRPGQGQGGVGQEASRSRPCSTRRAAHDRSRCGVRARRAGDGGAAVLTVTSKNLVHAALYLAVTLAGIAGVFLTLRPTSSRWSSSWSTSARSRCCSSSASC